jgi:hypothetical protein
LAALAGDGVACHTFHGLLSDLSRREEDGFSGSAGGDLAEIIAYYKAHEADSAEPSAAAGSGGIQVSLST